MPFCCHGEFGMGVNYFTRDSESMLVKLRCLQRQTQGVGKKNRQQKTFVDAQPMNSQKTTLREAGYWSCSEYWGVGSVG
jgi:hypothetical protein